jgi:Flp pilus assembly protein CpaB
MSMKRIQVILSVALCTVSVALFTASIALAQAETGSEPGRHQVPVVEQVEPQDMPSADAVSATPLSRHGHTLC